MLCERPIQLGNKVFGCGDCLPCRVSRKRVWKHRILLEALMHSESAFLTLTYDENHCPAGGTLVPRDVKLFIKKLRKEFAKTDDRRFRYYLVGEYGDISERPHYHAVLFGFPPCRRGRTEHRYRVCCDICSLVKEKWGKGGIDLGTLTQESADYVCGYVVKKLTKKDDERLQGRYPEFSRQSTKPGIAAPAMEVLAATMITPNGEILGIDHETGDVPLSLKHGNKNLPLGRYLRRKLRENLRFEEIGATPEAIAKGEAEMLSLLQDSINNKEVKTLKQLIVEKNLTRSRGLVNRYKIYNSVKDKI